MKNKPFTLLDQEILPGKQATLSLHLSSLYGCSPIEVPVHVFHGKKPGPVLCVTAAIHGDEVNGVEIVRRILMRRGYKALCGTLLAVPVANPYGFLYQNRYLMDRRDLNRSFPGSQSGSLAARLAHSLLSHVVSKTQYHIDLHSGSLHRSNLPQVRVNSCTGELYDLARVFNAPVILAAKEREGSLRSEVTKLGIKSVLYEAGEANRFDALSIRVGVRGIVNIMQYLGMLPQRAGVDLLERSRSSSTQSSYWVRSPDSGVFFHKRGLGQRVTKGDLIGILGNPTGPQEHRLVAPSAGIIIGLNRLPLVHEGQALFHIGCFDELSTVAKELQEFKTDYAMSEYVEMQTHPEFL